MLRKRVELKRCLGSLSIQCMSCWCRNSGQPLNFWSFSGGLKRFIYGPTGPVEDASVSLSIISRQGSECFIGWQNVKVYDLPKNFIRSLPLLVLMVDSVEMLWCVYASLSPLFVVFQFDATPSDGPRLVGIIAVLSPLFKQFSLSEACSKSHIASTCHDNGLYESRQDFLVPLVSKIRECVDESGLAWLLEGLTLDPPCSVIASRRSNKTDWAGHAFLGIRFYYGGRPAKKSSFSEGRTTPLRKLLPDDRAAFSSLAGDSMLFPFFWTSSSSWMMGKDYQFWRFC